MEEGRSRKAPFTNRSMCQGRRRFASPSYVDFEHNSKRVWLRARCGSSRARRSCCWRTRFRSRRSGQSPSPYRSGGSVLHGPASWDAQVRERCDLRSCGMCGPAGVFIVHRCQWWRSRAGHTSHGVPAPGRRHVGDYSVGTESPQAENDTILAYAERGQPHPEFEHFKTEFPYVLTHFAIDLDKVAIVGRLPNGPGCHVMGPPNSGLFSPVVLKSTGGGWIHACRSMHRTRQRDPGRIRPRGRSGRC